jgi:hypothetical protein
VNKSGKIYSKGDNANIKHQRVLVVNFGYHLDVDTILPLPISIHILYLLLTTMMTRYAPFVLILFSTAMAFAPMPKSRRSRLVLHDYDKTGHHISFNPMEGYKPVNEKRAKECAEHFGECSVEEMEYIRDSEFPSTLSSFVVCGGLKTQSHF